MQRGWERHVRATIWMQAGLVWSLKKFDYKSWVEHGAMAAVGEPVTLPAAQERAVTDYVQEIEKAGRFVMPDEVQSGRA